MKQSWERQKKHEKKKKNCWKWLSKNEIPNSNSLKSFEFERKTNIGDINSSRSDNEEEGAEAVVWTFFAAVSVENMFLEISQNSQENTCARVSFLIKLQTFCEIFKNTFFYRTPPVAASVGAEYIVKWISNS